MAPPRKKSASKPEAEKVRRRTVNFRMDEPLVDRLESLAEKHGRTFTSIMESAALEFLSRHERKPRMEDLDVD